MIQVEEYITKLLYNHDCVIVPGFGAFIANSYDARFDSFQRKFVPPGKQITFNPQLNHNDGLLAGSISRWLDISYDEAIKNVRNWVAGIKKDLSSNARIELNELGQFRLNENQAIVFQSSGRINFLKSAYGLLPVSASLVSRKTEMDNVLNEEMVEQTVEPIRKPRVIPLYAKVAAAAAAVLLALWLPFKSDINQLNFNYSELDFFKAAKQQYVSLNYGKIFSGISDDSDVTLLKEIDTSGVILWDFENSKFGMDDLTIPVVFSEDNSSAEKLIRSNQYHLIVGCFRDLTNANRLVRKLNKSGAGAKVIGKRNGLNVVSFGAYKSKEQASKKLIWVKENVQPQAWILKY